MMFLEPPISDLRGVENRLIEALQTLDRLGETRLALRVDHARAEVAERVRGFSR